MTVLQTTPEIAVSVVESIFRRFNNRRHDSDDGHLVVSVVESIFRRFNPIEGSVSHSSYSRVSVVESIFRRFN